MRVRILGDGVWGSAVAYLLQNNCEDVSYIRRGETIDNTDVLILAIPTQAIRAVLGTLKKKPTIAIVNCAKGIERKTHKLPFQIIQELLGKNLDYFSLIGPSFAQEVKEKMPTLVNLGFMRKKHVALIENLFQTDYFRVQPTKGVETIELLGALKNVYAIAAGIADGLGFEMNTRAKLVALAFDEFNRLAKKLRFPIHTSALPAMLGDSVLTCGSTKSRNFTFGKLITSYRVKAALERINSTVEGYYTVSSIPYFAAKTGVSMPVAALANEIISANDPKAVADKFAAFVKQI